MTDPKPSVVLWSREQARLFRDQRPEVRQVLSLTPNVRAVLHGTDAPVTSSSNILCRKGHLRGLARCRRLDRDLDKSLSGVLLLPRGIHEYIIEKTLQVALLSSAIWEILKDRGPWLICIEHKFVLIQDIETAHRIILQRLHGIEPPAKSLIGVGLLRMVLRICNRLFIWQLRNKRVILTSGLSRGMRFVTHDVTSQNDTFSFLRISSGAVTLHRIIESVQLLCSSRERHFSIFVDGTPKLEFRAVLSSAFEFLGDRVCRNGIQALAEQIMLEVEKVITYRQEFKSLFSAVKPEAVLLWDAAPQKSLSIIETAKAVKTPILVAAHAPVTPPDSSVTRHYRNRWGRQIMVSKDADITFVQSPIAHDFARSLDKDLPLQSIRPFMYGAQETVADITQSDPPMILYVGNFFGWPYHSPWLQETSDEMVESIKELVTVVSGLHSVDLIVRAKANWRKKGECDIDDLKVLLPEAANCSVTETGSFQDDLHRSMLVVSFASSTIEEALLARRPVLLWGGNQRYMYIKARTTPPSLDDRAAVYMPPHRGDLKAFIEAIVAAHAGRPLTDTEVSPYVWMDTVPGRELLVNMLISGDYSSVSNNGNQYKNGVQEHHESC